MTEGLPGLGDRWDMRPCTGRHKIQDTPEVVKDEGVPIECAHRSIRTGSRLVSPISGRFENGRTNTRFSRAPPTAVWRNGSASDYESGGCSFEYYLGHIFLASPRESTGW